MHNQPRTFLQRLGLGLVAVIAMMAASPNLSAQRIALKTNALEYLTLSPNLTLEARLSRVLSLQVGVGVNPITKPIADFKFTNFRIEPELRYWFNRPMARHFIAVSTTAGNCDIQARSHYFKYDIFAAGVSYGYALVLSKHWNMETEIGLGIGVLRGLHSRAPISTVGESRAFHVMPVPIRFGLSFSYIFQ